jgi:hypothetical protein
MEISSILMFAILGMVISIIITGGVTSMMDQDPSTLALASSGAVGSLLGVAGFYGLNGSTGIELPAVSNTIIHAIGGARTQDMKVGLPSF